VPAAPDARGTDAAAADAATVLADALRITRDASFARPGYSVSVDSVAHPEPLVRAAIDRQLRAWVAQTAAQFRSYAERELRCTATLALPSLVSYLCVGSAETQPSDLGDGRTESFPRAAFEAFTWVIRGSTLRAVTHAEVLTRDLDEAAGAACRQRLSENLHPPEDCNAVAHTALALGPDGLIVAFRLLGSFAVVEQSTLTWRDLGGELRTIGPLALIPGALDHVMEPSRAFPAAED
jgi:hypothetical protein